MARLTIALAPGHGWPFSARVCHHISARSRHSAHCIAFNKHRRVTDDHPAPQMTHPGGLLSLSAGIPSMPHTCITRTFGASSVWGAITGRATTVTERRRYRFLQSCDAMFHQRRSFLNLFGSSQQTEWARAVSEAEQIVGYSTSFMSLRCLLSDELANVALHLRKLVGTNHPLLETAKSFLADGKHTLQTRGLIVLLMSKAGNASDHRPPQDAKAASLSGGIYASQRDLAEISEMIHTAFLVHQGVVNLLNLDPSTEPVSVMELGNKMAVLSGDYLLATACKALAGLRNTVVVELVSRAIAHLTEAAFMTFGNPPDSSPVTTLQPEWTFADWERYVYLSSGTLIGHSCRGALELTNHGASLTESAFEFGRNIAWAQQLHTELQPFLSGARRQADAGVSLTSAPVILYLQAGQGEGSPAASHFTASDSRKLVRAVKNSAALKQARDQCHNYADRALHAISAFPPSDSRTALQNMVYAVRT